MKYKINEKTQHRALEWLVMLHYGVVVAGYVIMGIFLSDLILGTNILANILV